MTKFEAWLEKAGVQETADAVGVSRQAMESYRRFAGGTPRSKNSYPPTLEVAARIAALSAGELLPADLLPFSSATESASHGRKEPSR